VGGAWTDGKFQIGGGRADAYHGLGWIDDTGSSQVWVAYTYYGDATLNGKVDATDLAKVPANYNQPLLSPASTRRPTVWTARRSRC
jgi:hypothetical protein